MTTESAATSAPAPAPAPSAAPTAAQATTPAPNSAPATASPPAAAAPPASATAATPAAASEQQGGNDAPRTELPPISSVAAATAIPVEVDEVGVAQEREADERESDTDSAFESRLSAYTASLSSSVVDYPMENGRRYHAFRGGSYILPNDEQENGRLDLLHLLTTKATGALFLAPVETGKLKRVLDIGTGTGIWAVEMGDLCPQAEILGNDLSPIQSSWVPPNVKFEVDDVESPWTHEQPFDYIFCRSMTGAIGDYPKLARNIFDHLEPGAWAEMQDFDLPFYSEDGSYSEDMAYRKWASTLHNTMRDIGRDPAPGSRLGGYMKDAGFENVKVHRYKLPIGTWPRDPHMKEIGMCNIVQLLEGLEGFSMRVYCQVLKWSVEEVQVMLSEVRKDLRIGKAHAMYEFYVAYGQKPGGN